MAIILGIDPGTSVAGFGLISVVDGKFRHIDHGVIKLPKKEDLGGRLRVLFNELTEIIKVHQPEHMAIEKVFLGKNVDSAFKLGHARGVCMLSMAQVDGKVHEYAARWVKQIIAGSGQASKEQVRAMAFKILGISSESPLDASDALAIALAHGFGIQQRRYMKISVQGEL